MTQNMIKTLSALSQNEVWLMYSCEDSDPYFKKFITSKTIVPAATILSNKKNFLMLHGLDAENITSFEGNIITYTGEHSMVKCITEILKLLNYPTKIYLNFSDKMDSQTDVLGYGAFRFLHDNINEFYKQSYKPCPEFVSADALIYALMDSKSEEDIKYLKVAANRALAILEASFKKIKTGMSEKQILSTVHKIFDAKPMADFRRLGIVREELSWEREMCPVVLTGTNLKKGGHSCASERKFMPGDTIYFDFGVKITLKNDKQYSSDIQRMGYALKKGETSAPEPIQRVFDTLVDAINMGMQKCTPSAKGYEIDECVRGYIMHKGYLSYDHATGHPVGQTAHSPGTSLSAKGHKRSSLFLQENGVYTIEPRIQIENGGSVEEMIMVTKKGGQPLCPPQKKLYYVK